MRTTDIGHSLAFPFITKLFSPPPPLPPRRLSSSGNLNGACADSQISGSQRVENFHRRFARRNTVRLSRARNRSRRRRKVLFFRGPNFFLLVGFCQVQRLNKAVVSLVRTRLSVGQSRNFFDSLSTQSSDRSRNKSNRNKLVSCRKSVDQLERENLEAFSRDSLDRQQRAGCS